MLVNERPLFLGTHCLLPPLYYVLVGIPAPSGLISFCRRAPRTFGMSALALAFASAVRVLDRVHRHAPHLRKPSEPSRPAGLAYRDILVIEVPYLQIGRAHWWTHVTAT